MFGAGGSPDARDIVAALQSRPPSEKESRTPAQRKISSQLLYEIYRRRGEAERKRVPPGPTGVKIDEKGRALVDVRAEVTPAIEKKIRDLGGTILSTSAQYLSIIAAFGTASIDDGSFDPDGDPLTLTQAPPNPYPLGMTSVLLTATDPKGAMSQASGIVTVVDQTGPSLTGLAASPASLWPPNHKMVPVTINYGQSDNCPGSVSCVLSVSSNEASNNNEPDWIVVDAHHVLLRSEREGSGPGRTYTITLTCTDAANNVTVKTATVLVPHDQGR